MGSIREERLVCSKEVKKMILTECIQEFRAAHPEMDKVPISHEKILFEIAKFYLNTDPRRER